ncbi:MAG: glycosyltransferase, partial [Nitriliruptoraceae bacterium]
MPPRTLSCQLSGLPAAQTSRDGVPDKLDIHTDRLPSTPMEATGPGAGDRRTWRPMVRGDPGTDRLTVDLPRSRVHTEFAASDLAERKAELATSVAVVIPALNEEATVGRVVEVLQATLVDTHNLIDELVVVDADSTDRTAERARAAGAHVVRQSSILPEAGPTRG